MKEAERELTGAEKANDAAEMAGWGVEEAEAQNNKEASKYPIFLFTKHCSSVLRSRKSDPCCLDTHL